MSSAGEPNTRNTKQPVEKYPRFGPRHLPAETASRSVLVHRPMARIGNAA